MKLAISDNYPDDLSFVEFKKKTSHLPRLINFKTKNVHFNQVDFLK